MNIAKLIDFFIHPVRFSDPAELKKARLLVRGSLMTSLFSNTYLWLSFYFEFEQGVIFMLSNVIGFLLLPFLVKTRLAIKLLGNLYVLLGAVAVISLAYYSGGINSALYPWIISIPLLAILIVDNIAAYAWGALSFTVMLAMGVAEINGFEFPVNYNTDLRAEWLTAIVPGLLLIALFIAAIFEYTQRKALQEVGVKNDALMVQKDTIVEQAEELKSLVDDKDYIIRILAHDLRGPLRNIEGLVKLMDLETIEDKRREIREIILRTTKEAENLVNRVLEMDKSHQSGHLLQVDEVDISEFIKELTQKYHESAYAKGIKFSIKGSEMVNRKIKADRTYLSLIFENLLSNAIKFSPAGSQVVVNFEAVESRVRVKIIDQGPGIPDDEIPLLFKKFSKLSPRPTAGESSTGLGLALVKRYTSMIHGEVYYEKSPKDFGACFVVELPTV